ncbi:hypothetical protein C4901_06545 [Acidiferrobacter sp. SPIII_3]|uniref:hypothetical protein n=1 Tax=Acidiferrobacter sp. SPIII_3 TaxID=1281578 RepID=UPI000D7362CA|nr:hypothetical protein [Acidiferrobacter sp. SPIII_3]AWP23027.1 hypothetical protein C4901_06545 [Acidiferrobacter sp. SPIII_3]
MGAVQSTVEKRILAVQNGLFQNPFALLSSGAPGTRRNTVSSDGLDTELAGFDSLVLGECDGFAPCGGEDFLVESDLRRRPVFGPLAVSSFLALGLFVIPLTVRSSYTISQCLELCTMARLVM